jgi:large conductance mechanosensitive channel
MLKEFRDFVMRGNVIDMAVGIIIGASFGGIIASLVKDVLMPPIGLLMGGIDFSNMLFVLKPLGASFPTLAEAQAAGAVTINIGVFINTVINFLIVAAAMFWLVKGVNSLSKKPAPADPTTRDCPYCTSTISIKATRCPHCTSELKGK